MQPVLSVIIPVYNCENYLEKCLESIINQTFKEIEIILIDDGSTDKSYEIMKKYSDKDKRITIITRENSGPAATRNYGINIAKGRYIGFVDSDDYIEYDMYKNLIDIAIEKDSEIAMCNYKNIYVNDETSNIVCHGLKEKFLYDKSGIESNIIRKLTGMCNYGFFSLWNKIYLREWLLETKIEMDESREHGEDWWFNINLYMKLNKFVCIDYVGYNYIHRNNNSLMNKYREEQFQLFLDGRLKVLSLIPENLIDYDSLNKNFVYEFSSYIIRTYKEVKDKKRRNELINTVITNSEVIECCMCVKDLPIHLRVTTILMKRDFKKLALLVYKLISLIK